MTKTLQAKSIQNLDKARQVLRGTRSTKATVAVRGTVDNGDRIEFIIPHPADAKKELWFVFDINGKLTGTAYPNFDAAVNDIRKKYNSTDKDDTTLYFDEMSA